MVSKRPTAEQRREIEARVLLAALKQSMERGDVAGASLAHRVLSMLLQQKQQSDTFDNVSKPSLDKSEKRDEHDKEASEGKSEQTYELDDEAPERKSEKRYELDPEESGDESEKYDEPGKAAAEDKTDERLEPGQEVIAGITEKRDEVGEPPISHLDEQTTKGESQSQPQAAPSKPDSVPTGNLYELLGVSPVSSFEVIHVYFLRLVKKLLAERTNRDTSVWQFRDRLKALCVAHDVLRDPRTRTDYDFRLLGVRGESLKPAMDTPDEAPAPGFNSRPALRIGELLQCSEILQPKELEIAIDMHKAMPEIPFGQFLVKQEFLNQPELDSALLGQQLIADGRITVAQFQVAMYSVRTDGIPLGDTLVTRAWASQDEIDARASEDPWAKKVLLKESGPTPTVTEVNVQSGEGESSRSTPIAASNAVPSWAGQLDWGEEETGSGSPEQGDAVGPEEKSQPESAEISAKPDSPEPPPVPPKVLGIIIDTADGEELPCWPDMSPPGYELTQPVTVELDDPPYKDVLEQLLFTGESPEPPETVEQDQPSVRDTLIEEKDEIRRAKQSLSDSRSDKAEESEPEGSTDKGKSETTSDAGQPAASTYPIAMQSLAPSLEEALALQIQLLERDSPRNTESKAEKSSGSEANSKLSNEPSLDTGELPPPPWPGELGPSTKSKGERQAGKAKKDKSASGDGHSRRSKKTSEIETGLADLDNDVE